MIMAYSNTILNIENDFFNSSLKICELSVKKEKKY